jgi:hypothetical protein
MKVTVRILCQVDGGTIVTEPAAVICGVVEGQENVSWYAARLAMLTCQWWLTSYGLMYCCFSIMKLCLCTSMKLMY